ncbi:MULTISPECIES: endolytic transglycosylase MltG [unclassified Streptomyces]|uniref:endolytic transglycosylase MltG n=1 Tax=unclassified Streptomyces TaxID=2593676 RepID=UPI0022510C0C|nr:MULTISPECIES: endolytic transglycosylase MltG [unclassified Streptomyces]MCX5138995.1 endolytic transglycosylase MltG [Streptomyces sp. NBC_00338]WSU57665.1 endolytic transglycosylase MltG [Streptomyces sp. NBC_01104]
MTEYGRGPGSEPWHPEDPLYGDQGWGGQQPAHGQSQYDGRQQPYPSQDPYAQQHPQQDQQHQQDPYAQQHQQDPYAQQPQYQQQPPYGAQQDPYAQQPPYNGGWDTGQQPAAMPYEGQQAAPYGYGETNDYYGTPEAYPPPQPPGRREAAPEQAPAQHPDWDPEVQPEETHPFFTGADDGDAKDDDSYDDGPRESRRGNGDGERRGKGKKKKGRSGCACLVVSLVLVGGLGGAGYVGYSFYKDKFGAAPDYAGSGSGSVEVEIPKGAYGYDIGNILKKAGVVKSVDAFVSAQNENPKGKSIQAGVYLLHSEMSASEAVKMMVDPKSQNLLVIPEGTRNVAVYAMVDKKLNLKKGTTEDIAKSKKSDLGLPGWASKNKDIKDPLEGFLYPAAYPVTKETKPEAILKKMVSRSNEEYDKLDLAGAAKKHNLDGPWQMLTAASLVQAEGKTHDDFRKMAEVIYNRLKPTNTETNQYLQFDSSFNYLNKQSKINITLEEIRKNKDPYNTYTRQGLTPGPIGNPGNEALAAALNPTNDGWIYFVATDGEHKTEFAKTYKEFLKLKEKFDGLD